MSDEHPTAAVRYFFTAIAHGDLKGYLGASVDLHRLGRSGEAIHLWNTPWTITSPGLLLPLG